MRHMKSGKKLGRTSEHRRALFRNQLRSLIEHERIITTLVKAKTLRPIAEKLVTLGRRADSVHARRLVGRMIEDRDVIKRLFSEIGPRFVNRPGGYTRIVKLGPRRGDNAELAIIEFVDYTLPEAKKDKAAESKKDKAAESKKDKAAESKKAKAAETKKDKKAKQPAAAKAKVEKPAGV